MDILPAEISGLIEPMLSARLLDQELWRILGFSGILLLSLTLGRVARWFLGRFEERNRRAGRDVVAAAGKGLSRSANVLLFAVSLVPAFGILHLADPTVQGFTDTLNAVIIVVAVGFALFQLVLVPEAWLVAKAARTENKLDDMIVPIVAKTLRAVVILLTLVQVATVLSDKPVTSIIAGLGIGGLAIGLAAQDTIKNFFGSVALLADKPFEMGDRIKVSGFDGMVEGVGLRSTKIRTLEGHLVAFPNGDLANQSIENVTKRKSLRRVLDITVTYDTAPEKVEQAIAILKELLAGHEGLGADNPPRVFFHDFGSTALVVRVMYWYTPADWWAFVAFNERLNLEILRRFNAAGIDFAFPTQTLHLAGDPKRPVVVATGREG